MDIKQLFTDDDAVSPVIGVILMVAITVILAAVIASFVLGLGQSTTNTNPQVSIGFDYESNSSLSDPADGDLTISHDGGDSVSHNEVYVRGDFGGDGAPVASANSWADYDVTTDGVRDKSVSGDKSKIVSGDRLELYVGSTYDLDVVYQSEEGSSSSTLGSDEGPDA